MNIKKIFILFLIFNFTFSNVGLPLTLHICNTMKKVSLDKCEMCKRNDEKPKTSCCAEKHDEEVNKVSFKSNCCNSKVLAKPIKDNFISSQFALKKIEITSYISNTLILTESEINNTYSFYFNTSPPNNYLNSIYKLYSILLI